MVNTIVLTEHNKIASIYKNQVIIDLIIQRGSYQIDDIYLGIVETVLPSINAAFIILDYSEENGFLHIDQLGHLRNSNNTGDSSNIASHLVANSIVMVQVLKQTTGHKGPTVTGEISLKGRYLTLLPFQDEIILSRGIENNDELVSLKMLLILIKPKGLGVMIKKTSLNTDLQTIVQDFYALLYEWDTLCNDLNSKSAPSLINRNKSFISKVLQNSYTDQVTEILVDSYTTGKQAAGLIGRWQRKKRSKLSVNYFTSDAFIIRNYNLDLIIHDLLQPRINLIGGGYVIIEKTEALTTIDVNSGSFNYLNNPRETILSVNRKAAKQIARHIKLRNISGVIIVDFIDMKDQHDQLQLLLYFDSFLKQDEKKPRIIQFSELGLVELTRKREGKSLSEVFDVRGERTSQSHIITNMIAKFSLGHTLFLESFPIYSV
nr:ribonuclease E [Rhodomonas sp. NIES-1006]